MDADEASGYPACGFPEDWSPLPVEGEEGPGQEEGKEEGGDEEVQETEEAGEDEEEEAGEADEVEGAEEVPEISAEAACAAARSLGNFFVQPFGTTHGRMGDPS